MEGLQIKVNLGRDAWQDLSKAVEAGEDFPLLAVDGRTTIHLGLVDEEPAPLIVDIRARQVRGTYKVDHWEVTPMGGTPGALTIENGQEFTLLIPSGNGWVTATRTEPKPHDRWKIITEMVREVFPGCQIHHLPIEPLP